MNEKVFSKKKVIVAISAVLVVLILLFIPRPINVSTYEESFTVKSVTYSSTINYEDIIEIHLLDEYEKGTRTFGMGSINNSVGNYRNDEGSYKLYVYNSVKKYVYVKTNSGFIVFNQKSVQETINVYDLINSKIS